MGKPERDFMELFWARQAEGKFVCVGLDSDYAKIPQCVKYEMWCKKMGSMYDFQADVQYTFNASIVEATGDIAAAFKINEAFYSVEARPNAIPRTIRYINDRFPGVPVIIDSKRADIGNTNVGYARDAFEDYGADAITVNPYFGSEAMKPFLDYANKGVIVLVRTSNPGSDEFQNQFVSPRVTERIPLWQLVARTVKERWNYNHNCCVVAGATHPDDLPTVRAEVGHDIPILIPGYGAQGGGLDGAISGGVNINGQGILVNNSRSLIFPYEKEGLPEYYAQFADAVAHKMHEEGSAILATLRGMG